MFDVSGSVFLQHEYVAVISRGDRRRPSAQRTQQGDGPTARTAASNIRRVQTKRWHQRRTSYGSSRFTQSGSCGGIAGLARMSGSTVLWPRIGGAAGLGSTAPTRASPLANGALGKFQTLDRKNACKVASLSAAERIGPAHRAPLHALPERRRSVARCS